MVIVPLNADLVDKITKLVLNNCIYMYLQHLIVLQFISLDSGLNETFWKIKKGFANKHTFIIIHHYQAPPPHVSSSLLLMDSIETRIAGR